MVFFIVALFIVNLNARCTSNGLSAFPSGNTLGQNPIIVIDGYAASQEVVIGFDKEYSV